MRQTSQVLSRRTVLVVFVVALALGAGALTHAQTVASAVTPVAPADGQVGYLLGVDDQLLIQIADVPDLNGKTVRIDPNGELRLPMIGRVRAAGLTPQQLETDIASRLKLYLQEPDVAVTVAEFRSQAVSVIGAVGSSGVQQVQGQKTLIEVLSAAGGVTQDAGPIVRVTRRASSGRIPLPAAKEDAEAGYSTADVPLRPLLEGLTPEKNIVVRANDVVAVPRAQVVYVVGEVGKPGALPLSQGGTISLVEAISASGGTLRTATPEGRILRQAGAPDAARTEITVDIKKIMQGKAPDVSLRPGDIVVVPDSTGKRAAARAVEAAIQAGLIFATYGILH